MSELIYKEESFRIIGLCMEVHRELGKGHDEIIYKEALQFELETNQIPFARETGPELSRCVQAKAWIASKLQRGFSGLQRSCALNSC
jgi:GxxExxY protein